MTDLLFRSRWLAVLAALVVLVPTFGGCDSDDDPIDEPVLTGGVDFARLFAAPTAAELQAVRADWAGRTPTARDVNVEFSADLLGDGSTVAVLSHTMTDTDGTDFTHYGAVRLPAGDAPDGGWPVLVLNHGGDRGLDLAANLSYVASPTESPFGVVGSQSVVVFPTFRSETMFTPDPLPNYVSGGAPSPWDRDVDDAFALLDATLQTYPAAADAERLATLGISRGGNVSLLMAERDDRIDAVVDYFGPTDFTAASIQGLADTLLTGSDLSQAFVREVPGAAYLEATLLDPLAAGTLSYDAGRLEVVKRSSAFFAETLPNTQAHHHQCDIVVPFDQYLALEAREEQIGGATDFNPYDAECPDGELSSRYHSFAPDVMPGNFEDTNSFLGRYLIDAARPAFAP